MERSGLELSGDGRRQLAIGEKRLCVTGGNEIELALLVELSDREQWTTVRGCSQGERSFEFGALRLGRTASGEEPMGVLPRDAELTGQIGDGQPLAPQKRLPDFVFIVHGDDGNRYPAELRA